MERKKNRQASPKKYAATTPKTIAREVEAPYTTSYSISPVHVARHETNYVKRSLTMMGLASTPPFSSVENVSDFINCIRSGVPKKALDNLIEVTGINATEMAGIIRTSDRTLRRYLPKQKLNPEQSERVIELARVYSRGEEVFGTLDAFREWMSSSVMALGNKRPKEFLDTSMGIEMLIEELGRIEHGIFA
jgi:putative toxin-antitoxin system antitoxin component (TIGR02293 family)